MLSCFTLKISLLAIPCTPAVDGAWGAGKKVRGIRDYVNNLESAWQLSPQRTNKIKHKKNLTLSPNARVTCYNKVNKPTKGDLTYETN